MRERLERMLGAQARAAWILTFHAACGRMLRREAERLGYRSTFTIYDQADQVRVVRACLEDLGVDPKRFTPRGIHSQISNAKNQLIGPDEYMSRVASFYDKTVAEVYERYQQRLLSSNAVDFDDMLMLTVEALERFPDALAHWQHTFRYILVDEYQDTNHAQYRLLQLLAGGAPERVRRGRSGSVGLWLPGRRHQQHPRLRARLPGSRLDRPRAELPLDERDPRRRQCRDREQPRPQAEAPLLGARRGRSRPGRRGRGRAHRGALRRGRDRPPRRRAAGRRPRSPSSTGRMPRAACSRTCSCASRSRIR